MNMQADEFTDELMSSPTRNILDIDLINDLTEAEHNALKSYSMTTVDLKSVGALKRRMVEFVHMYSLEGAPVRPGTLNRRFNKVAHKFGTSTMEIINTLIGSGHLVMLERRNINAVVSKKSHIDRKKALEETGGHMSEAIENMMLNAI